MPTNDKNSYLKEVVFELHWNLPEEIPGGQIDPVYKILVGSLYEKVREKFEFHESLPTVDIPDEISPYLVKHRFRSVDKKSWPLIQLGPGIITYNETVNYSWDHFRSDIDFTLSKFLESYNQNTTSNKPLSIKKIMIRYIYATEYDTSEKAIDFLEHKLKVQLSLPNSVIEDERLQPVPFILNITATYPLPDFGTITFKTGTGKSNEDRALIWETLITSNSFEDVSMDVLKSWIDSSRNFLEKWFEKFNANLS